jgi:hypothetical protein
VEDQRTEPGSPPAAAPNAAAAPQPTALEAALAAANAERDAPPAEPSQQGQAPAPATPTEDAGAAEDDEAPNPDLPQLTRGQTRKLFEQWETERRPRFFKDLEATQAEAERLRAQAQQRAAEDAAAAQGYEAWYGPDQQYAASERAYDQIVSKLERGEYVPDQEIQAARTYQTWRTNRQMAGTVHQKEAQKVLSNVDALFRQARIDGVDVGAILAEVSQKKGHPGHVLQTVAEKVAAEWKGKLEAEQAAHAATKARLGIGRAPSAERGGRAPSRGDLVASLAGGDMNAFIERAKSGDFADLDLSDR